MMFEPKIKITSNARLRRKGRFLYHSKRYSNPYFRGEQNKKIFFNNLYSGIKVKIFIAVVLVLFIFSLWLAFYSPYFNIKNIEINGLVKIEENQLKELVWQNLNKKYLLFQNNKNIFLFDTQGLYDELNDKYAFNSLKIKKRLPDKIVINCEEKDYAFIWQEENAYFYIDEDGYIISQTGEEEIKNKKYPLIINNSDYRIKENKVPFEKTYLDFIAAFVKMAEEKDSGLNIKNYLLDNENYTVKLFLIEGVIVKMTIQEDVDKQLNKLLIIKNQKLKNEFTNKKYIDVRYGDRVFINNE